MYITDKLYGQFAIEEVLNELLLSEPVQRLKGIHQGGASYLVNPKWNVTRYEHSIGVMLLSSSLSERVKTMGEEAYHKARKGMFVRVI